MPNSIEVSPLYLDSVLQVLEQLLHEVEDDAVPTDAAALLEETRDYLNPQGEADASEEEDADAAVEEAPSA